MFRFAFFQTIRFCCSKTFSFSWKCSNKRTVFGTVDNFLIMILIKVIIDFKHFYFICAFVKPINFKAKLIYLELVKLLMSD